MCKQLINGYTTTIVDGKETIMIVSRNYKGSPDIAYAPNILIIPVKIWHKYRSSFWFQENETNLVFLEG